MTRHRMRTGPVSRMPRGVDLPPILGGLPDPDPDTNKPPRVSWSWATVVSTDPIQVILDGPGEHPLPVKEGNCLIPISSLSPPTRVWVQVFGRRLIIVGQARGGTQWEPCTLAGGIKPRDNDSETYGAMVRLDSTGMVHFQGQFAPDGIASSGNSQLILTVPPGYEPRSEVRWIGFTTEHPSTPYGGWIVAYGQSGPGELRIRIESDNPNFPPTGHWCVIAPPWEPIPVDQMQ